MRLLHQGVVALALMGLPNAAGAVEIGSADMGKAYAAKVCAECHEIEATGDFSPNPEAPTFQEVADTSGMSLRALGVWLRSSHPTMPNFILSADEIDNVSAYIMSLRTPR
jgi:mono/diheme cytochrome c family protein